MTNIFYLIRPAPYDYLLKGMDLYDSFNAVATNIVDVGISSNAATFSRMLNKIAKTAQVFCANDKRAFQTALLFAKHPIKLDVLHEIRYGMNQVMPKAVFFGTGNKPNIVIARRSFAEALARDGLAEDYSKVSNRTVKLLDYIKSVKGEAAVLISHGFFMKFVEIYLKENAISQDTGLFLKHFKEDSSMFGFCEGISGKLVGGKFVFDRYIRSTGDCNDK